MRDNLNEALNIVEDLLKKTIEKAKLKIETGTFVDELPILHKLQEVINIYTEINLNKFKLERAETQLHELFENFLELFLPEFGKKILELIKTTQTELITKCKLTNKEISSISSLQVEIWEKEIKKILKDSITRFLKNL